MSASEVELGVRQLEGTVHSKDRGPHPAIGVLGPYWDG